jgi:signal transduction histidine kinase/ligand-binding sensor domain-containing protein
LPTRHIASCVLLLLLSCAANHARALDPTLQVSQYAHTAWNARDGAFRGAILSITQTNDGYLWLGTGFGLLRFDGVRFVEWQPPLGSPLPKPPYPIVYASRDGSLWIGAYHGLARIKNGTVTNFPQMNVTGASSIVEDKEGTIWTGGTPDENRKARLCTISGDHRVDCVGQDGAFGNWIRCIYEDSAGNLWVSSRRGVWRWKPGISKLYPGDGPAPSLSSDENGTILIANYHEVRGLIDDKEQAYPMQNPGGAISASVLFKDKEGGVWIGTEHQGLLHMHQGKVDTYRREDGLSNSSITSFFEDREGNVWVGTYSGLDQFHQLPVPTITSRQGFVGEGVGAVLVTRDGTLLTTGGQGLTRAKNATITHYSTDSGLPDNYLSSMFEGQDGRVLISTAKGAVLFQDGKFLRTSIPGDEFFAIVQDGAGNYWISVSKAGLVHANRDGEVLDTTPWKQFENQFGRSLAVDRVRGGVWIGFYGFKRVGLVFLKDGKVLEQYGPEQGFQGQVTDIQTDSGGTVWAATEGGLARIKDGNVALLNRNRGLPCDNVFWKRDDAEGNVWLLMACGLVRVAKTALDAWADNPQTQIKIISIFDRTDGIEERFQPGYYGPQVAKTADDRLLFVQLAGLSVIDPRGLAANKLKPPTVIEHITADGKDYGVNQSTLRIPPLPHDLRIDYTALSLVDPRKVRFRYQLEGQDPAWQDPGTRRQAFYSGLRPGRYRFRVMASNNDGLWNEEGASVEFRIAPAWFQTAWFRALCAAAFLLLLWAAYKVRLQQLQRHITLRLEERVNERERIAREFHDTLLQSTQGLILLFQGFAGRVRDPEPMRAEMEAALDQADSLLNEARDRLSDLRTTGLEINLEQAITRAAEELLSDSTTKVAVVTTGTTRPLVMAVADDIYRIAREALTNVHAHARANMVEIEIAYETERFRLNIRDDGRGLGEDVLQQGSKPNHFGLQGMRERAQRSGGAFNVWSREGAGTEIALRIPAKKAYAELQKRTRWMPTDFFRRTPK